MAPSNIDKLPRAAREQVERAIVEANFTDYVGLAARLAGFGKGMTKSSLHRHGQKLKSRMERARFEVEVMENLGDLESYLLRWARRDPKAVARLVRRLQKQEQQKGPQP